MTFAEAVAKGINQIHVHCYADNVASAKMIQAGGGVLQSEELIAEGQSVQRYVIECF
jgi:predicted acetyltransferase